jgi:hypothetical protein
MVKGLEEAFDILISWLLNLSAEIILSRYVRK